MMTIDMTGKTVEDAIDNALRELNVTEDKVEIKVLDEGSKGFFNIIGTRPAKVNVCVKRDMAYEAKDFLRQVLDSMGIKSEIKVKDENDVLNIEIIGPNMGILIGYRGETLDSLQYLTSLEIGRASCRERV